MPSDERIFVAAIRHYCAHHDIPLELRADGWLVAMGAGPQRRFAFGYDIGLNSAIAHRLANDKSATSEVLALSDVPCIPHQLFLNPNLGARVVGPGWRDAMRALLAQNPQGVVVKPNEGTAGRSVFRATTEKELEHAIGEVFAMSLGLVISPYVEIEEEVRVILLDGSPLVVYSKQRGSDWRHNLDLGARPLLLDGGEIHAACARMAADAARAIGIRFASIDLVRVDGAWRVLEINSGVMMETLGKLYPELVQATYDAALDRVFGAPT